MLIISEPGRGPAHVSAVLTASKLLQLRDPPRKVKVYTLELVEFTFTLFCLLASPHIYNNLLF